MTPRKKGFDTPWHFKDLGGIKFIEFTRKILDTTCSGGGDHKTMKVPFSCFSFGFVPSKQGLSHLASSNHETQVLSCFIC